MSQSQSNFIATKTTQQFSALHYRFPCFCLSIPKFARTARAPILEKGRCGEVKWWVSLRSRRVTKIRGRIASPPPTYKSSNLTPAVFTFSKMKDALPRF